MFGNASVDLTDYIKNTDIANTTKAGVVKINPTYGVGLFNDTLIINGALANDVKSGNNSMKAVSTYRQHESTFYGLAKASGTDEKDSELPVGQYTDEAKSSIQNMLDVPSTSELKEVNDSKADVIVESASGDIVSFNDGADDMPLKSLVVDINPVQNLNGYDSPWVGGGGKNLLDPTLMKDQVAWNVIPFYAPVGTVLTMSTNCEDSTTSTGLLTFFRQPNGTQGAVNNVKASHPVTQTIGDSGYIEIVQRNPSNTLSFADFQWQIEVGSTATDWTPYENICPINGWTAMNVVRTGKNLFDKNSYLSYRGYFDSSEIVSNVGHVIVYIRCMPNTTYTVSRQRTVTNERFAVSWTKVVPSSHVTIYDKKSSTNAGTVGDWMSLTITTGEDAKYLAVWAWWNSSVDPSDTLQIEYSDTRTEYEPFGRTINVNWETETGTVYGGKLDVLSGKLVIERVTAIYDGTETYTNTYFPIVVCTKALPIGTGDGNTFLCSHLPTGTYYANFSSSTKKAIQFSHCDIVWGVASADELKAKIAEQYANGTPVTFVYPLAESIEIQLTPQEVKSLLGTNNIWADTGATSVEYCADTELYINKVKPIVNVDDVQINGTSIITDGVANVPIMSSSGFGVAKVSSSYGTNVNGNGQIIIAGGGINDVKAGTSSYKPVVPARQHESTFYGLAKASGDTTQSASSNAVGNYTEEAKASIQNMLGITDKYSPKEWVAESETELVTNAHSVGDLFYIGETLYKVIADLNAGDAVNVGVNVEEVNVNDIINDYATKEDVQDNVSIVEKSASGAIANFSDGADNIPLKSLVVDINPVQDLHGYDSPWVGGGGKNKCAPFEEATSTIQYRPIYVGDGTFTASSTSPWDASNATVFFLAGNVSSGASSSGNGIRPTVPVTQTAVDGYVTIAWRKVGDVDPTNYQTQIESGSTATTFTPYENICPISGWTGCNIQRNGTNLFDGEMENGDINQYTGENNGTSSSRYRSKNYIPIRSGSYYFKSPNRTGTVRVFFYDKDKNFVYFTAWNINAVNSFNTSIVRYARFRFSSAKVDGDEQISINSPSSVTDYVPYQGQTIPISWQTEAGTVYGGKLDVLSGVLTVEYARKRVNSDLGSVDFNTSRVRYTVLDAMSINTETSIMDTNIMCSHFPKVSASSKAGCRYSYSGDYERAFILFQRIDTFGITNTLDGWNAFLADNNVYVTYKLKTPITYQLTPHEVNSLLGVNNIWADSGDTSVEYFSQVDEDLIDYVEANLNSYAKKDLLNNYVNDIQIDGTSIVSDGVANVPIIPKNSISGVDVTGIGLLPIRNGYRYGFDTYDSGGQYFVKLMCAPEWGIRRKMSQNSNGYGVIDTWNAYMGVFYGLPCAAGANEHDSNLPIGQYDESEKSAISEMLGGSVSVEGTTPTIVAKAGIKYVCGEVLSLDFTPSVSGICDVVFISGSTPTVLTVPSTVKWTNGFDPTSLDINTTYELNIMDGLGVACAWT